MAVDRGGLQYRIVVRDQFSKNTQLFRDEIRQSQQAFQEFKESTRGTGRSTARSLREGTKATREQTVALRKLAEASRRERDAARERSRLQATQTRDSNARIRQIDRERKARRQLALDQERVTKNIARAEARVAREQATLQKEVDRRLVRQRQAQARAARERATQLAAQQKREVGALQAQIARRREAERLAVALRAAHRAEDIANRKAQGLNKTLAKTNVHGSQLLFTFRRLVGVLALFTAARLLFREFVDTIRAGVQFQDTIKQVEIGVGALLSAVGDVRDEFGNTVPPARELALAQQEARRQTQLLRQDALATTATFEQLLDTFQVAIAPGLTAGLDINQVREFTVQISQAATALGLAQNQLAEEIRSILQGTIQARTTRIAVALGITNEDIRRLKETGELFDFLSNKFQAFSAAAEIAARQTFGGITVLLQGAFREVLGRAAAPLFESLIENLNDLFDTVVTVRDELGRIRPNPQLVAIFTQLFAVLKIGVDRAREFGEELGFEGLFQLVGTLSTTLLVLFEAAFGAGRAVVTVFVTLAKTISDVSVALGISNAELGGMVATLTFLLVSVKLVLIAFSTVAGVIGLIKTGLLGLVPIVSQLGVSIKSGMLLPFLAIGVAVGLIEGILEKILEKIFDVDLGIKDTVSLIALGFVGGLAKVIAKAAELDARFIRIAKNIFAAAVNEAKNFVDEAKILLAAFRGDDKEVERLTAEQEVRELAFDNAKRKRRTELALKIADIQRGSLDIQKGIEEEISRIIGERAGEQALTGEKNEEFGAAFKKRLEEARALAEKLAADFNALGNPISTVNTVIDKLSEALGKTSEKARDARREFEAIRDAADLTGTARQIEDVFGKIGAALAKDLEQANATITAMEEEVTNLLLAQATGFEFTVEKAALLRSLMTDLVDLEGARVRLSDLAARAAQSQAAALAARATPAIERENAALAVRVEAETRLAEAVKRRASQQELDSIRSQSAVEIARQEIVERQKLADINLRILRERAAGFEDDEERENVERLIEALEDQLALEQAIAAAELVQLQERQRLAELVETGTLSQGLTEGFRDFAQNFASAFESGIRIATGLVEGFARFASKLIVDAFDPTTDVDLRERIGRFLQNIANMILQELLQSQISKIILSTTEAPAQAPVETGAIALSGASIKLGTASVALNTGATTLGTSSFGLLTGARTLIFAARALAAANAAGVGGAGAVKGGNIRAGGVPSIYHNTAPGYDSGGRIRAARRRVRRPRHLDPRDNVPIWAQAGEFMFSKAAVQAAGLPFMEGLHSFLRGEAGSMHIHRPRTTMPEAGYQTGGSIAEQTAAAQDVAAVAAATSGAGGQGGIGLAAMVPNEAALDRMLAGGSQSFFRFFEEHAGPISDILAPLIRR